MMYCSNCSLFLHLFFYFIHFLFFISVSLMRSLFVCALVEVNISGINDFQDNIFNVLEKVLLIETLEN